MTTYYLPLTPTCCHYDKPCVYRDQHLLCDQPRINKGNSDAACFRLRNKDVLGFLSDRQDNKK